MRHSIVRRRFLMRHSIVPMLIDISLRHSSELKRYLNELPLCCLRLFRLFIISSNFLAVWNTRSDLKCSHFRLFAFLVTAKGIKTTGSKFNTKIMRTQKRASILFGAFYQSILIWQRFQHDEYHFLSIIFYRYENMLRKIFVAINCYYVDLCSIYFCAFPFGSPANLHTNETY